VTAPDPTSAASKPRRRFQYSLRTLLGFVFLLAVVLSCLSWFGILPKFGNPEDGVTRREGDWVVTTFKPPKEYFSTEYFREQNRLLFTLADRPPQLWDTRVGRRLAILDGHWWITCCGISPDGTQFAMADLFARNGSPNRLGIWDLATGKQTKAFQVAGLNKAELSHANPMVLSVVDP
jgi:WD40 repeat protein